MIELTKIIHFLKHNKKNIFIGFMGLILLSTLFVFSSSSIKEVNPEKQFKELFDDSVHLKNKNDVDKYKDNKSEKKIKLKETTNPFFPDEFAELITPILFFFTILFFICSLVTNNYTTAILTFFIILGLKLLP